MARAALPYVYVLFDFMGIPFYVGKGTRNRDRQHERKTDPRNMLKNETIERTWKFLGEIPKIRIVHKSNEDAFAAEKLLISIIGRIDLGTGPLTNLAEGGPGFSEYNILLLTPEERSERMRQIWNKKPPEERSKMAKDRMGRLTQEERSAVARRYASYTPEQRKEYSARRLAAISPERRKIAAQKRLGTMAPERLREMALNASNKMSPEQRSKNGKLCAAFRMATTTQEHRSEQQRQAMTKLSPEWINENLRKARAAQTRTSPGQRGEYIKRGWANMTPERRCERLRKMKAGIPSERRSEIARRSNAAMTAEQRSERARKINAAMTVEQRRENCLKARNARKLKAIMYNGELFPSRAALADYLAQQLNRSAKNIYLMLMRHGDDGDEVICRVLGRAILAPAEPARRAP